MCSQAMKDEPSGNIHEGRPERSLHVNVFLMCQFDAGLSSAKVCIVSQSVETRHKDLF